MKKLLILLMLIPTLAQAQPKFVDTLTPVTSSSCDPVTIFKGLTPQNFMQRIKTCGDNDLKNAIEDANTLPLDYPALGCLVAVQTIKNAIVKGGILTGFQGFRRAKQNGLITNCTNYVLTTVTP